MHNEVFIRHPGNPLLEPEDLPFHADGIFNPGVAEVYGGVVLLVRTEDRRGISALRTARSRNGVDGWVIADVPLLEPDLLEYPFEEWGCEDARITKVGDREWVIAYTAYSRYGPAVALATTKDFETVQRLGIVLPPSNKDAAVLPGEFAGSRLLLHRPVTGGYEHIWYASSEHDWVHWSEPGVLLPERGGPWWDGLRVGVGAPPFMTDDGWLLIYHGVKQMLERPVYRLGLALLDKQNPRKVLARADQWVLSPEADYEQRGLVPGVVYTCGALLRGDETWLYYGAADTVIALAIAKTADLLSFVWDYDYLHQVGREKGMHA